MSHPVSPGSSPWRRRGRRLLRCAVAAATLWAAMALFYLLDSNALVRTAMLLLWLGMGAAAWWSLREGGRNRVVAAIFGLGFAGLLAGFLCMQPQQDRDWADDVARLLRPEVDGDHVVLHNVRDFDWRSDSDYEVNWETRSYDLSQLQSADLAMSYWMGPAIAHTLVSFGFADGQRVVFSLEIRKERDEQFSALGGFFHKFEEVVIAADERDILRVRTNARGEDMYLYRLNIPPAGLRQMFLGYLDKARQLQRAPRFYNTLTSNCTTIVYELARLIDPGLPLDWRLLLSGYAAEYAYDHGGLTPGYDFATLKARGHITAHARAADAAVDFSRRIRIGVPGDDPRVRP